MPMFPPSDYFDFYFLGGAAFVFLLILHPRVGLAVGVWLAAIYGLTYLPS